MKIFKKIWNAITFPFVSLEILWNESKNLVFGDEKKGAK